MVGVSRNRRVWIGKRISAHRRSEPGQKTQPWARCRRCSSNRRVYMQASARAIYGATLVAGCLWAGPASAGTFRLEKQFELLAGERFVLVSELGGASVKGVAGSRASILVTAERADLAERYDFRFE